MNWEVDGFNLTAVIEEMENGGWKHVCNCNYGHAEPEKHLELNKTNAKLIAAAPDLLDACELALSLLQMPSNEVTRADRKEIEAAIKKAKL